MQEKIGSITTQNASLYTHTYEERNKFKWQMALTQSCLVNHRCLSCPPDITFLFDHGFMTLLIKLSINISQRWYEVATKLANWAIMWQNPHWYSMYTLQSIHTLDWCIFVSRRSISTSLTWQRKFQRWIFNHELIGIENLLIL